VETDRISALELKGLRVAVLGAGRSGLALAQVLRARGARVLLSDSRPRNELPIEIEQLSGVELEAGGHSKAVCNDTDLVCISPGIRIDLPVLEEARQQNIPIMGEIEVAFRLAAAPFVAVTGTNGKGTTVSLIHGMLEAAGIPSLLAGNIGTPLVGVVDRLGSDGYIVAEISSFQLESISTFRPFIAMVLNITPDHQDRHPSYDHYLAAKARIFENQGPDDLAILNADDPGSSSLASRVHSRLHWFSRRECRLPGAWLEEGNIMVDLGEGPRLILAADSLPLRGPHNQENVMAAALAASLLGVAPRTVQKEIQDFKPLHHRLEFVGKIKGVAFYDDSKGTNPEAVMAALESFTNPVIIAGGRDKGLDFAALGQALARRARGLVSIGEAGPRIAQAACQAGLGAVDSAGSLEEAIVKAGTMAAPDGVVVLSPACASFDMFRSAEERGDIFARLVREMGR